MIVKNIGFVSTRFSGTDGVTLESSKWAEIMKKNGQPEMIPPQVDHKDKLPEVLKNAAAFTGINNEI